MTSPATIIGQHTVGIFSSGGLELGALHPNRALNMAYDIYSSEDPDQEGTVWERSGQKDAELFESLKPIDSRAIAYWCEIQPIIHMYSRCLYRAKREWSRGTALNTKEYDRQCGRLDSGLWLRSNITAGKLIFRVLLIAGFGVALSQVFGFAFVPEKVAEATGRWWPGAAAGFGAVLLTAIVGFLWRDFQWKHVNWSRNWREAHADWQQAVAFEHAYNAAWVQLCNAYRRYTGEEYTEPPAFVGYIASQRRTRERNLRHWQLVGMNAFRYVWTVFRRFIVRKREKIEY